LASVSSGICANTHSLTYTLIHTVNSQSMPRQSTLFFLLAGGEGLMMCWRIRRQGREMHSSTAGLCMCILIMNSFITMTPTS